tara:strand:+ start:45 stop:362 length:318 start_codon:yes stop_codon:yes gene_type:complete
MQVLTLNYDSVKHYDYEFMKGVYSNIIANITYNVYVREETNCFIDIGFDIDGELIYNGKKKKGFDDDVEIETDNNYTHFYHKNNKIYLIKPIENDDLDYDAKQIL